MTDWKGRIGEAEDGDGERDMGGQENFQHNGLLGTRGDKTEEDVEADDYYGYVQADCMLDFAIPMIIMRVIRDGFHF